MAFSRTFSPRPKLPLKPLLCWLAISLAAACLPASLSQQLKDQGRLLLAPGQRLAWSALKSLRRWGLVWQDRGDRAVELAELRQRVRRLDEINQALRANIARQQFNVSPDTEQPRPLLDARAIETRVLGEQSQVFLERTAIVGAAEMGRVTPGGMAIDAGQALVDSGENASLSASGLALMGGRVWGKVVEVCPQTASVRRVNSAGYRGLVQIVDRVSQSGRPLAQGVVEGTGDALCRIRMVDARSPVSVGDLVVALEERALTDAPLIYGRITRAELTTGAARWELWMEPAVANERPQTLTILQPQLNEERLAQKKPTASDQR